MEVTNDRLQTIQLGVLELEKPTAAKAYDDVAHMPGVADKLFAGLALTLEPHDGWMLTLDHDGQPAVRDGHDWAL